MIQLDFLGGLAGVVSAIMDLLATPILVYFLLVNTTLLVLMGLAGGRSCVTTAARAMPVVSRPWPASWGKGCRSLCPPITRRS
jgi:hypothetical protein